MSAKTNQFWTRDDVRISLLAVALAAFGMAIFAGLVLAGLAIWHHDFRRRFGGWFANWLLAGLAAAWLLEYPISARLNTPPSWVAAVFVIVAAMVGVSRRPQRRAWR